MNKKVAIKKKTAAPAAEVNPASAAEITQRAPNELAPWEGNAKKHDEKQIAALMTSIEKFGFRAPIITNEDGVVLAGHGRLEAAKRLGLEKVPTMVADGLTKTQQRAYVLADNKISQMTGWDKELLTEQIEMLIEEDFAIETTGFSTAEIDIMLDGEDPEPSAKDPADLQPEDVESKMIVSRPGDIYRLGPHRLYCGDSLMQESFAFVLDGTPAEMVITDPPYNVKIDGNVCGSGEIKHDEFFMASGEMSEGEFTDFLGTVFALIRDFTQDGAIIYSFMDWRHQREILNAAEPVFGKLRQLCIWSKDNAGMGTFYRSQHELVYVFKNGDAPHINNFALGQYGRYRTNVWNCPGVNSRGSKGHELLKLHPTVKPTSLIADAIRDCSNRGGVVFDPFAGSGTILVAAERTGRKARAIEIDPKYVDVAIRRWERFTGDRAVHIPTGSMFHELEGMRAAGVEGY